MADSGMKLYLFVNRDGVISDSKEKVAVARWRGQKTITVYLPWFLEGTIKL